MKRVWSIVVVGVIVFAGNACLAADGYREKTFKLDIPAVAESTESAGGILVADVDGDGRQDFLVTVPGHVAVHGNDGRQLWLKKADVVVGGSSESVGLPGHHGPGVAAGDVDGDGKCEVLFLTKDRTLHVVDGRTGKEKATAKPPVPKEASRWEFVAVADFRGNRADRDILLQATNRKGYRTGRYLAAYKYDDLIAGNKPLWTYDKFGSCAHNGARLADLDGDGRDEVLGATILSPEGKLLAEIVPCRSHIDSVFVADVRPELPGLELVLLEEGENYIQVIGLGGPIWRKEFRRQEPQNAAVGPFKKGSDEIFIWCRSRYAEHQKPFVFNSQGKKVFDYKMDDVAPEGWTASGVEVIHAIDWTGRREKLACAKERHESGDVCLFEPLTGRFVLDISQAADRLYVADVFSDWREEILVLAGNRLTIYENTAPNPRPNEKRLWTNRNYRRLKQCYNYYSP